MLFWWIWKELDKIQRIYSVMLLFYINQDLIICIYSDYITSLLYKITSIINTWLVKTN